MVEEFLWSIFNYFYIFVSVFEFLCTTYDLIMAIPTSINTSCQDKKRMGSFVSVGCIVQQISRPKVFIFHGRKSWVATNIAKITIDGAIFWVGIIKICSLDILRILKIQKLEKKYHWGEWGRSSCDQILQIFYFFVCLFEFLCTIHDLIMAILISLNSSCKDKKKMGWIVSVLCIVQELCRFKVFNFHIRKSSTAMNDSKKKHTWDKNWHGEHQNSFTRHLEDSKKLG